MIKKSYAEALQFKATFLVKKVGECIYVYYNSPMESRSYWIKCFINSCEDSDYEAFEAPDVSELNDGWYNLPFTYLAETSYSDMYEKVSSLIYNK